MTDFGSWNDPKDEPFTTNDLIDLHQAMVAHRAALQFRTTREFELQGHDLAALQTDGPYQEEIDRASRLILKIEAQAGQEDET